MCLLGTHRAVQWGFYMLKGNLRLVSPRTVIGTVPPKRVPNAELRTREYLTEPEVDRLIAAAKANRNGHRDATMILIAFRHGLRAAAELVDLRWDQIDLGRHWLEMPQFLLLTQS